MPAAQHIGCVRKASTSKSAPYMARRRIKVKEIELFVQILEDKFHDFYQILPRPDLRRGLLNLGGNILKTILGTASVSDIHELHGVLDLQNRNSDIVHSLANQLTYKSS